MSSTFRDMQSERHLVQTFVVPALRARCRKYARPMDVLGIDLRWGLTEAQTTSNGALGLCLRDIGRCQIFLGFVGSRYGYVPPEHELLREGITTTGESITAMEIRRGALHPESRGRSIIYLRENDVALERGFPSRFASIVTEERREAIEKLAALRDLIRSALATNGVRDYRARYCGLRLERPYWPAQLTSADECALGDGGVIQFCEWDQVSDALRKSAELHGVIHLDLIDTQGNPLGPEIERELGQMLDQTFAERRVETAAASAAVIAQRYFLESQSEQIVGRADPLGRIHNWLATPSDAPWVVTGTPGSGKSTLLAGLVTELRRRDPARLVLPFFVGTSPRSTELAYLVRSLLETIALVEPEIGSHIPTDPQALCAALPAILAEVAKSRDLVLVIDGLNQLDDRDAAHELNWLPLAPIIRVHVVVSTLPGACLARLERAHAHIEYLPRLSPADRAELVQNKLRVRCKSLPDDVIAELVKDTDSERDLPLYLTVALEELSLASCPEALGAGLSKLPGTIRELFDGVVERLTWDDPGEPNDNGSLTSYAEVARLCLGYLAVSRVGLSESELVSLLSEGGGREVPLAHWRRIHDALLPYLRPADEENCEGLIGFFHEQLRLAALRHSIETANGRTEADWHVQLAAYFAERAKGTPGWKPDARSAAELPYHLARAGQTERLRGLLVDPSWLESKLMAIDAAALLDDFELVLADDATTLVASSLRLGATAIAERKYELRGQLVGRLVGRSEPLLNELRRSCVKQRSGPWLEPLYPALAQAGGALEVILGFHRQPVTAVSITVDGRYVVSAGEDNKLCVWDAERAKLLRYWSVSHDKICALAVSGERLVTSGSDGQVLIWNLHTGVYLRTLDHGHASRVSCLAVATRANVIVAGSHDGELSLWCARDWQCLGRGRHGPQGINAVAITPDGQHLASGSYDGSVMFWSVGNQVERQYLGSHSRPVQAVAIAAGEPIVFSGCENGEIRRWQVHGDSQTLPPQHAGWVRALCLAGKPPRLFSAGDDRAIRVWDPEVPSLLGCLDGHSFRVRAMAVSDEGLRLASVAEDTTVRTWRPARRLEAPRSWSDKQLFPYLALSPDGSAVAVSGPDPQAGGHRVSLQLWTRDCESIRVFLEHPGPVVFLDPRHIATIESHSELDTAGESIALRTHRTVQRLTIRELPTASITRQVKLNSQVSALAKFTTSDGDRLLAVGIGGITVWNHDPLECISDVQYPIRGRLLAASNHDGSVIICAERDVDNGRILVFQNGFEPRSLALEQPYLTGLALLDDGRTAVTASCDRRQGVWPRDWSVSLWDLVSGNRLAKLPSDQGQGAHSGEIWYVSVSGDSRWAVSGSDDHRVAVWDLRDHKHHMGITLDSVVMAAGISADGSTVAAVDEAYALHVFKVHQDL